MSISNNEIIETIETIFKKDNYFYSDYILEQLKKQKTIELLKKITEESDKTVSEVIIIFIAAIRYIKNDLNALDDLEKNGSFINFIKNHYNELIKVSVNKKVQGNIPERGFPILEILGKKLPYDSIGVIELGASYGLIGACLLDTEFILKNKDEYYQQDRKLPENPKKISKYIGIDIDPPDKEWLLACFSVPDDAMKVKSYIDNLKDNNNFQLIKASAIGFSKLNEVNKFVNNNIKPVILTSFMLYQFNDETKKLLFSEINEFTKKLNGHWISQEVEIKNGIDNLEYYIDWDGKRIMKLKDDKCSQWEWIVQ